MRLLVVTLALACAAAAPCDIYAAAGTPCVAAHSVTRALFSRFAGPLYTVRRAADNATRDITPVAPGGVADAAAQDAFCARGACVILRIFDQTGLANHLDVAPGGGARPLPDAPVNATRLAVTLGGARVYAAFFEGKMGYRIDNTTGVARGNTSEVIYMVTSGLHANGGCCL
jgi:hypothetical protein